MDTPGNYELLIDKINVFIRKYYFNNLLRGLIFLGAGLFSAYVVITISEYFGNFNTLLRTILFYAFILLNLSLLVWLVIPSLLAWLKLRKSISHDEAAAIIGKHFSDVSDKLLNTLQLKKLASQNASHIQLIEASIDQKIETLKPISFPSAINLRENNKYLKWALFPFGVICVLALAAPSVLTESTKRIIHHNKYFAPLAPFGFVVMNSNLSAVQGEDVKLELKLTGNKLPADVYVETAGNTFKLDKENLTHFHYLFTNLQQSTTFRLSANGYYSRPYQIKVNLKPSLLNFDVQLSYPAYLHKKNEMLVNAGDLTIPAGTVVKWQLHTQNATRVLFSLNNNVTPINGNEDVFEHTERINKTTVYSLKPESNTVTRGDSASYRINVIADELPEISVQEKQDSVSSKALYFNGRAQDDHGFSSLAFHYHVGKPGSEEKTISKMVKADLSQTQTDFFYFWDMKDLGVKPGDEVSYYFEVADNDAVAGPKKARTPERTLRMPTETELNDQLNAGTKSVKEKMQSAVKIAGQLERDAQRLNQMLLNKSSLSFDEKKQVEDLLQKKRDLNDLIKDIQDENKKNLYNRQENQQQNADLTEKQQQIEQLLNNVLDPKTEEMLRRLKEMLDGDHKEDTRDAVNQMQNENRNLKRELDRMQELYKKLEFDQKLNQTVNQLNKLADQQQQLAEKTQQNKDQQQTKDQQNEDQQNKDQQQAKDQQNKDQQAKEQQNKDQQAKEQQQQENKEQQANAGQQDKEQQQQLQQEQDKLKQDFQALEKQMDELQKQNEQLEDKSDFKNSEQQKQSVEQEMNNSKQSLQKNDRQKASQSQKNAARQMKQMARQMKEDNQESEDSQNTIDAQQLRELLKSLVNSSFEQEKVMQTLRATNTNDPNYVVLAQKQKEIKDNLKTVEDTIYAISRRIPQIQTTVNTEIASINDHIDQALDNLGDRRTPEANRNQQYSMTSMNNLALMLSDAKDQLQNSMSKSKSGKGKQQKPSMQQLSRMQQQLNQNMQKMREQMQQQQKQGGNQGKSQRQSQSEQLARMARMQQDIRQQLEQINREDNKDGTRSLGDLDKIAKQMEQTEDDLVNKRITDEALKRQQQIQSRMLEAEKAEQQREQDQQRESHAGKDVPPGYIKALQDYQQAKSKQTEQIKTVPPALNLYYKEKIKSYFDQINAK